jgi:hypothetical protein
MQLFGIEEGLLLCQRDNAMNTQDIPIIALLI